MKVKRSLALLLTLLMLCSLMPNAFAVNLLPGSIQQPADSGSGGGHTHDWGPFRVTREPTCSEYGYECIRIHGWFIGSFLALWRILRCNPFSRGGVDYPPEKIKLIRPKEKL